MSQNLGKTSSPPKFFLAGTHMSVRDCAYSDTVIQGKSNLKKDKKKLVAYIVIGIVF